MTAYRIPAIIAVSFLALYSCNKEDDSSGTRLKMIRHKWHDSLSYEVYQYDDQNRLTAIIDSNNNGGRNYFVISYDGQGKISSVTESTNIYTFDYDSKGRIIKKIGVHDVRPSPAVEDSYSYDMSDRISADSIYNFWAPEIYKITNYSYDGNSNITKRKTVQNLTGEIVVEVQCTYDNHPNPLAGKSILTYLFANEYYIPNQGKNNLLKEKYPDGTTVNYTYEYYSNGLPKKCAMRDNADPSITYAEYYYE